METVTGSDPADHELPAQFAGYELADRFRLEDGRVFLSGVQAVARLPADQLRIDRRNGLNTAAFVSGYQGSPVGTLREEVSRAVRTVPDLPIVVRPGVNEELAATAVMGSQLADERPERKYDGVLGMWYGKAPGLDRACDAIRHAVFAGTSPRGGVVAVVGDDPAAKSSTLPSSSDATLVDLHMPIVFPGDVQEALDLARHSVALSRASGVWVGYKLVTAVADGTGTVDVHPDRVVPAIPTIEVDGEPFVPRPSGRLLTPYSLEMEREFQEVRSVLARQYGVLNRLNQVTVGTEDDWLGIAASGHTYHELREALRLLGFTDDESLRRHGIRLMRLSMPVPLDDEQVRQFAHGLSEVLVVEEKNPTLEVLVRSALYTWDERPAVVGRHDEHGAQLIPGGGAIDADKLLAPLRSRLVRRIDETRIAPLPARDEPTRIPLTVNRTPFYCSGCPHNISTRVPPGSLVGGGIGCHAMIALMDPDRVGDVAGLTAMGNEGAQWIGMSPFVDRSHIIQNLGDGTYFHSGSLAVRAAVAAGVNITFKLLYNGTVAMTGGQDPQGQMDVPERGPGAAPRRRRAGDRHHRRPGRLSQRRVRAARRPRHRLGSHAVDRGAGGARRDQRGHRPRPRPGLRCREAARPQPRQARQARLPRRDQRACVRRLRRLRRQEQLPVGAAGDDGVRAQDTHPPDELQLRHDLPGGRLPIVRPRDRRWHEQARNRNCPARRSTRDFDPAAGLDEPTLVVPADEFVVRLSGIGGTGVVTVSQILGTAAMLAGRTVRGLDQTGLSQKAGPVVSDLRMSTTDTPTSNRANSAGVDCFLAFDLLVGASDTHRTGARRDRTIVIGSAAPTPTGAMVAQPTTPYPELDLLTGRLAEVSRRDANRFPNAAAITSGLFGDALTANMFLLGVAVQAGAIPVSAAAIERAIELNGVAVDRNVAGFRWGRRWCAVPNEVEQAAGVVSHPQPETLDELIERLAADLTDYQSARVCGALPPRRRQGSAGRAAGRRGVVGVHRRRRSKPAQADGLQGRVRGRPPAPPPGVARRLRGGRRAADEGHVAVASTVAASPRQEVEDEVRAAVGADVQGTARRQGRSRHTARPVPLGRGAPHRAGDDPRVHHAPSSGWPASSPLPTSPRRRRSPPSPTRSAATRASSSPAPSATARSWPSGCDLLTGAGQPRRMIWSARSKATARWLTAMTVSPAAARFSHRRTSVSTSTALERSSRTTSSGRWTSALAVARR